LLGPLDGSQELGAGKANVTYFGASAGDRLGYSVLAADVNDDGTDDVVLGATGVTAGVDPRTDQGRVYVFFGGSDFAADDQVDLIQDNFDFAVTGAEGFGLLGYAMAEGDVNGDGARDLVVGAPFAGRPPGSPPGSERTYVGEAYIILGEGDLRGEKNMALQEYDAVLSGAQAEGQFAAALALADVNDDDKDDIIVGSYRSNQVEEAQSSSGGVYVFFGRDDLPRRLSIQEGDEDIRILGPAPSAFGFPLASGDFNGDGTADFAAGAQLEGDEDLQGSGTVRVFFGGDLPADMHLAGETADITIAGQMVSQFLPSSLSSIDLDADGADELLIGSLLYNPAPEKFGAGAVYVVTIGPEAAEEISLEDVRTIDGEEAGDRFGNAVGGGPIANGVTGFAALAAGDFPTDPDDDGLVYIVRPGP
jgi:hypothetical protein